MPPRDEAIIRFLKSRQGIIAISLGFTVAGIVFILLTGRYELSFFVFVAILPWFEHWHRLRKK